MFEQSVFELSVSEPSVSELNVGPGAGHHPAGPGPMQVQEGYGPSEYPSAHPDPFQPPHQAAPTYPPHPAGVSTSLFFHVTVCCLDSASHTPPHSQRRYAACLDLPSIRQQWSGTLTGFARQLHCCCLSMRCLSEAWVRPRAQLR